MAVFSTNQTRHFYVVNSVATGDKPAKVGEIKVGTIDGVPYLSYMGHGEVPMRSDLLTNIEAITLSEAADMKKKLPAAKVTLKSTAVVGKQYILRIVFNNFIGASDEYTTAVVADYTPTGTDAKEVYKGLALILAKNLAKHITPLATVHLTTSDASVPVTAATKEAELTGTYTGLEIKAAKQPWILGTKSADAFSFNVALTPITVDGVDVVWGTVDTKVAGVEVPNGETIADMEYFYMKERADQYGNIGWPNVVHTNYLVDPNKEYNAIDIHYAFVGSNESVQKSEKDITIVYPNTLTGMDAVIDALKSAAGIE